MSRRSSSRRVAALLAAASALFLSTPAGAAVITGGSAHAPRAVAAAARPATPPPDPNAAGGTPIADPSAGDSSANANKSAYSDPFRTLGAKSPFCARPATAQTRRSCALSGSIAHTYPASSYGIDNQVSMGVTQVHSNILGSIQDVAAFVWLVLVYVLKGVLLMLEWAFSLDILNSAMSSLKSALATLHNQVLGQPWFLFAISVAGLWGIFKLAQRKTTEVITGLFGTVCLMVIALVLIANPAGTIGNLTHLSNQASLGVLSASSSGTIRAPQQTLASSMQGIFNTTVLKPWAALEFGDPKWALSSAKPGSRVTNADVWLTYPAQSGQRASLYKLQSGQKPQGKTDWALKTAGDHLAAAVNPLGFLHVIKDYLQGPDKSVGAAVRSYVHKDPSKVSMQQEGGTFPRIALLALISVGLIGAICLYGYLGVRLVLAGIMSLLLLLLAPAMLIAPAFGESGRMTFLAWGKRLIGAIVAKLIYALLLALLTVAAAAIQSLQIGWLATWLILIAFWWGVLLKHKELIGFITAGQHQEDRQGPRFGMMRAFYAARTVGAVAGGLKGAVTRPFERRSENREAEAHDRELSERETVGQVAQSELHERADQVRMGEYGDAKQTLAHKAELEDQLRATNKGLESYDRDVAEATARGEEPRAPDYGQKMLLAQRQGLRDKLSAPAIGQAAAIVAATERNQKLTGRPTSEQERGAFVSSARNIDPTQAASAERPRSEHLRAAGIDPARFARAGASEQGAMREEVRRALERDRDLAAAVPSERRGPTPSEAGRAAREAVRVDPAQIEHTRRERLEVNRQERQMRRRRQNVR